MDTGLIASLEYWLASTQLTPADVKTLTALTDEFVIIRTLKEL
jgi:hypothetical protein